jgi:hypothetical protein
LKAEIFIVTYAKDFDFTSYTLRSIEKFGRGFAGTTIVVPWDDRNLFRPLAEKHGCTLRAFYEAAGKGFLHHQVVKCEADLWCPKGTDVIVHLDADCVMKEPFSVETFMRGEKPILVREHFEDFKNYAARYSWRGCVEHALGVDMEWETMVRHPGVFWADMYEPMRRHIEQLHGYPFTQYVLLQRNEFPQSFAEFPTIGGYALAFQRDRYSVVTRVVTPGGYWQDTGIVPGSKVDLSLWEDPIADNWLGHRKSGEGGVPGALTSPVQYFWSRGGVTAAIRDQITALLGA